MYGQATMRIIGIIFWVAAIIIIMATYGVLAKPSLETVLRKGSLERGSIYYSGSLILGILFLTMGTFLIVYPFKK